MTTGNLPHHAYALTQSALIATSYTKSKNAPVVIHYDNLLQINQRTDHALVHACVLRVLGLSDNVAPLDLEPDATMPRRA